jgi:hypothetical protein
VLREPGPGRPAIEIDEAGDVYTYGDFVYWGFTSAGLSRLGRIVGFDQLEVVDELEIDRDPRMGLSKLLRSGFT